MCIAIYGKKTLTEHVTAYKNVRRVNGKFKSRYTPTNRVHQDDVGLKVSNWDYAGTDLEYEVGLVVSDGAPGIYVYTNKDDALKDSSAEEKYATLEVIIPRGSMVWYGIHYGSDTIIAPEIIVLRVVGR